MVMVEALEMVVVKEETKGVDTVLVDIVCVLNVVQKFNTNKALNAQPLNVLNADIK